MKLTGYMQQLWHLMDVMGWGLPGGLLSFFTRGLKRLSNLLLHVVKESPLLDLGAGVK